MNEAHMSIVSLILSIISIVISLAIAIIEIIRAKKINDLNLDFELFKDIIKKYLTSIIPNAYQDISFPNNQLSKIDSLQSALNSLMREVVFFKYSDLNFYKKIKGAIQRLEDFIVVNEGKKFDLDEQREISEKIYNQIKEIYKIFEKKYKNG